MTKSNSAFRLMAVAAVMLGLLSACGDNNPPPPPPPAPIANYAAPVAQPAPATVEPGFDQSAANVNPNPLTTASADPAYAQDPAQVQAAAPVQATAPVIAPAPVQAPVQVQPAVTQVYPVQQAPMVIAGPYALIGCPNETNPLNEVLAGIHGVDQWNRPLNACGYPVNVYGEPLESYPAPMVFYARPSSFYLTFLQLHYGWYRPVWGVNFYHPYAGAGVIVNRHYYTGGIPRTSVTRTYTQSNPGSVSVHVPAAKLQTVRPGAVTSVAPVTAPVVAGKTVTPGAANVAPVTAPVTAPVNAVKPVTPGAANVAPVTAPVTANKGTVPGAVKPNPTAVMPNQPAAGTASVFNRPAQNNTPAAVMPKPVAPAAVMPKPAAPATTTIFNRPSMNTAPAYHAPTMNTAPAYHAPTISRPSMSYGSSRKR